MKRGQTHKSAAPFSPSLSVFLQPLTHRPKVLYTHTHTQTSLSLSLSISQSPPPPPSSSNQELVNVSPAVIFLNYAPGWFARWMTQWGHDVSQIISPPFLDVGGSDLQLLMYSSSRHFPTCGTHLKKKQIHEYTHRQAHMDVIFGRLTC